MNNFFRALIAGYGAKKLGGGCLGTIIVFILIWIALGQCSFSSRGGHPSPETFPANYRVYHHPVKPTGKPTGRTLFVGGMIPRTWLSHKTRDSLCRI